MAKEMRDYLSCVSGQVSVGVLGAWPSADRVGEKHV